MRWLPSRFFLCIFALCCRPATATAAVSSHYYVEFPRGDSNVSFAAGSVGCNSRPGLRHLTQPECAGLMSGGLDVISGLARADGTGPWSTTNTPAEYYTHTDDDSYLAGCSIEFPDSNRILASYNTLTSGNEAAIRPQVTERPAQFCYSEVTIPLSHMYRQPVATANSQFALSDNTMQCPNGFEPVHNAEDCLQYALAHYTQQVTIRNDINDMYMTSSSKPDGCLLYQGSQQKLYYNSYHHLSGKYPTLSTRVSTSNQNNYRIICQYNTPTPTPAGAATVAPTTGPVEVYVLSPVGAISCPAGQHVLSMEECQSFQCKNTASANAKQNCPRYRELAGTLDDSEMYIGFGSRANPGCKVEVMENGGCNEVICPSLFLVSET